MRISSIIIFIGVIFILIGLVAPTLPGQMLNITTQVGSYAICEASSPNSSSSSSPTVFNSPIIHIYGLFYSNGVYQGIPNMVNVSYLGSVGYLQINGVYVNANVKIFPVLANSKDNYYYAALEISYNYTVTSNSPFKVTFFATIEVDGAPVGKSGGNSTLFIYSSQYVSFYGIYKGDLLKNAGSFYMSAPGYSTPQLITPSSVFSINTDSYPVRLKFYYVENNGTTTGMSAIYIVVNNVYYYFYQSNSQGSIWQNLTSLNGYTASVITVFIYHSGTYTVNGYVKPIGTYPAVQLLSIGMSMPQTTSYYLPSSMSFTTAQIIDYLIGTVLIILGVVEFYRGH